MLVVQGGSATSVAETAWSVWHACRLWGGRGKQKEEGTKRGGVELVPCLKRRGEEGDGNGFDVYGMER